MKDATNLRRPQPPNLSIMSKQLASKTQFNGVRQIANVHQFHAFGVLVNLLWSFPCVEHLVRSRYRCEH
jgi:hypothetical protein